MIHRDLDGVKPTVGGLKLHVDVAFGGLARIAEVDDRSRCTFTGPHQFRVGIAQVCTDTDHQRADAEKQQGKRDIRQRSPELRGLAVHNGVGRGHAPILPQHVSAGDRWDQGLAEPFLYFPLRTQPDDVMRVFVDKVQHQLGVLPPRSDCTPDNVVTVGEERRQRRLTTFVEKVWFDEAITCRPRAEIGIPASPDESFILDDGDTITSIKQAHREACEASRQAAASFGAR